MRRTEFEYLQVAGELALQSDLKIDTKAYWAFVAGHLAGHCVFLDERCAFFEEMYHESIGVPNRANKKLSKDQS